MVLSSAVSGTAVGLLCTPFDVVKNYWLFAASKSAALAQELAALSRRRVAGSLGASPFARRSVAVSSSPGGSASSGQTPPAGGRPAFGVEGSRLSSFAGSFALEAKRILRRAEADACGKGSITARSSTWEVARCLYTSEGLSVFWRGFFPAVCVLVPANVIFFSLYERCASEWGEALSGVFARSLAVLATAPVELARTKMQASCYCRGNCNSSVTEGPLGVARAVLREEGVRGLFRGVLPTLIRDVPFSALYWPMVGAASRFWENLFFRLSTKEASQTDSARGGGRGAFFWEKAFLPFLAGASSSAVACVVTHPMDVLKTKVQAALFNGSNNGGGSPDGARVRGIGREAVFACNEVYRQQGLRGFVVGLAPRLCKIVPSCAVLLASYEGTKALWSAALREGA